MVFSLSHSTFTRPYYAKVKERKKLEERGRRKGRNVMPFIKPCFKKDNTKKDIVEG
jgi:hypothetical protein